MSTQTNKVLKTHELPSQKLSQSSLLLGLLLSIAVIISAALFLASKRQLLINNGIEDARRVNTLLLEQTARVYDSVEILLGATAARLEDGKLLSPNNEKKLFDLLNSYITGMPYIKALSVLDHAGKTVATTFRYPTSHPDFSERGYFQTLQLDPTQGMYIDIPVRRKYDAKQWLLNVALALPSPHQSFGGVVVVSLVPEYFSSFYDSLAMVEGSYVSLLLEDSTLLMRHPAKDESIGKVFGRDPALQPFLQQRLPQTSLRVFSHALNDNIALNCRFAESHPIYLCIHTPEESLLKEWQKDVQIIGSVALLISITIMALFVLLSRQIRNREATALQLLKTNRELDWMSKTDHLTGIANRQHIESRISILMSKAQRHNRPFSVILLDIDHFKVVNDTHGHVIGDRVLQSFSKLLTKRIRATDVAGRWGGEEFLIACEESDLNAATQLAEILRQEIQNHNFGLQTQVTSSFGVTQYRAEDSFKTLLQRIDEHLYLAKDAGRNTVISH